MTHSANDVLVMFFLRLLLIGCFGPGSILCWRQRASRRAQTANAEGRELTSDLRTALRPAEVSPASGAGVLGDEEAGHADPSECSFCEVNARDFYLQKMEERKRMDAADLLRNTLLVIGFASTTCISMYCGLKCVVFHYDSQVESSEGVLLGSVLFLTNLEFFLLYNIVLEWTKDEGELLRTLHMHPLYYATDLKSHYCDVCEEEMQGPNYDAFRCRTCDFDLCTRCYRRKDKPGFKGAIIPRSGDEALSTWGYFQRIAQMALGFWRLLLSTLLSIVAAKMLQLAAPNLQGRIFDSIIQFLRGSTDSDSEFRSVISIYVLVNVLQGLFNGAQSLTTELVMAKIQASVRDKLFVTIVRMDIGFFDAVHTGQLTSRLTNDTEGMVEPLQSLMNDLLANAIMLVGGVGMAFYTSWKLSILALTVVPPISATYRAYARWGRKLNHSIYQYLANSNQVATESLGNIRTVRAFSTEAHETGRYREGINAALHAGIKNSFVGASVSAFSSYVNLATSVLILWYGGMVIFRTHGKDMSIGSLITFQLYWNMMNSAFLSLGNVFNELIRASSAAERVFTLLDARPEVDPDVGEDVDPRSIKGHLELRDIRFRYRSRPENEILRGISLILPPGSTTALVGKSGGGKSTLVHLLLRFYDPESGAILLDGRDLKTLKSRQVRQAVGFVAQETQLFATSIEANIAYGIGREYTKEELHAAARAANAHEFITEEDEGYETRVGEKGVMLSGGQKQRLAIARCFLRQPKLLFLDEATSALDAENEALVQAALERLILKGGCTVVLIAHRLSTVMNATQIAVMHKGTVAELGSHKDLVLQGGIYAQLVARQMQRDKDKLDEDAPASSAQQLKRQRSGSSDGGRVVQADDVDALFDSLPGADNEDGNASE
eukprot:TRINITY_DN23893_c0_g3_i1.p1 TRINITY_DN23893_c0_g3~~TRINITY_DN23893_c0_g3_i1.p1  ORF type:complete len:960 (-),score=115.93 TRINITY_DN23893_c0_g3_i1:62-2740(-)